MLYHKELPVSPLEQVILGNPVPLQQNSLKQDVGPSSCIFETRQSCCIFDIFSNHMRTSILDLT